MTRIVIEFSRFSAFYSPLIMTMAGGFLADEGLEPEHRVSPPGESAIASLLAGSAHVVQSAPAQGFGPCEKGDRPPALHFAQINERDGFFIAAREADSSFDYKKLAGKRVLVDHGGQPMTMFRYACHKGGVDFDALTVIDAGAPEAMIAAFRRGDADYVQLQGPAPQQLEADGHGHVVAATGAVIGPCAFSSLAATREWLESDMAKAFMRAYRKARAFINEAAAAEIAARERDYFPDTDPAVLETAIAAYQALGCWTPHVEITREAFAATLDIFLHSERITRRHPYDAIIAPPPA